MASLSLVQSVLLPDRARARGWYRAALRVSYSRLAALAVGVPLLALLLALAFKVGTAAGAVLAVYLVAATTTDLLWRRIPNWLTVSALAWCVALHASGASGMPSAGESLRGAGACFGVMLGMYLLFRGGEGDVKLLLAVGAFVGPWHGIEALAFGYLVAGAVAVLVLLGRATGARHAAFRTRTLPMAPFFALGTLLTLTLP